MLLRHYCGVCRAILPTDPTAVLLPHQFNPLSSASPPPRQYYCRHCVAAFALSRLCSPLLPLAPFSRRLRQAGRHPGSGIWAGRVGPGVTGRVIINIISPRPQLRYIRVIAAFIITAGLTAQPVAVRLFTLATRSAPARSFGRFIASLSPLLTAFILQATGCIVYCSILPFIGHRALGGHGASGRRAATGAGAGRRASGRGG